MTKVLDGLVKNVMYHQTGKEGDSEGLLSGVLRSKYLRIELERELGVLQPWV